MNAKKKILAVALAASMAVLAVGGSSLAYFTDTDNAHNEFTVGNVQINLEEPAWEANPDHEDVYPGEALPKDPIVTNTGANPAVVRIKLTMPEDVTFETNYQTGEVGEGWVYYNGYYYYTTPLTTEEPGNVTTALFDQIRLSTSVTNPEETNLDRDVVVDVQAVQAQGIFPSYSTISDGIDVETELPTVAAFFDNAFANQN